MRYENFLALVCAAATSLVVFFGSRAEACGCPQVNGPKEGVAVADVVVLARIPFELRILGRRFLVLDVSRVFKGDVYSQALLSIEGNGNNCDPALSVGGEYFTFAYEGAWPALQSTVCLPNSLATAVDARFLDALGTPYPPKRLWIRFVAGVLSVILFAGVLWRFRRRTAQRS